MYPVSNEFKNVVSGSHKSYTIVEVVFPDSSTQVIPVSGGTVDIDDSREIRTMCTVDVADPSLVPKKKGDLLHPDTGNQLMIRRGVYLPNGKTEVVPLCMCVITKPTMSESNSSFTFQVTGSDRALLVQRARWTEPYVISGNTNILTAARAILQDRVPGLPDPIFTPIDATSPTVVFGMDGSNDPWKDIQSLFSANGHEIFFNAIGQPVSRPVPTKTNSSVAATFIAGSDPLLSIQRDIDPTGFYTAVVVRGEGTGVATPVYAIVNDPNATEFIPYFLTSNMIMTQDQAIAAGQAMLQKVGSSYEDVQITVVPNPAITAGDAITVKRDNVGADGTYIASKLTIPLGPDQPMTITMKPQR